MKKTQLISALFIFSFHFYLNAQVTVNDFGRIVLNTYLPDNTSFSSEAKKMLETKLNQITTKNGIGGSQSNPRFIITATVNIGTKDIISGPPQMIAQNIDITLFIGDAITNTIFSNTTLSLKGVGTNENKAFIDAFKNINPKNKEVLEFLEKGKNKIILFYGSQCEFIIKNAQTLVNQENYDEAMYLLSQVPAISKDCYFKCSDLLAEVYQQKIDADCKTKLSRAKIVWEAKQNEDAAENTIGLLSEINPKAVCFKDAEILMKQISNKLKADEKEKLNRAIKQYNDKMELERKRIDSYKDVAVEYAKNQPKTIAYNNIYWR